MAVALFVVSTAGVIVPYVKDMLVDSNAKLGGEIKKWERLESGHDRSFGRCLKGSVRSFNADIYKHLGLQALAWIRLACDEVMSFWSMLSDMRMAAQCP